MNKIMHHLWRQIIGSIGKIMIFFQRSRIFRRLNVRMYAVMVLFGCFSILSAQDSDIQGPVQVQWGDPVWTSATHVRMPLKIRVHSGWKIYGPVLKSDEMGRPTAFLWDQSHNVWHVDAHWPNSIAWNSHDPKGANQNSTNQTLADWTLGNTGTTAKKSLIHDTNIDVQLDIALKDRSPALLKMRVQGLACSKVCHPFDIPLPDHPLTPPALTWTSWWSMVGLAFLGGLILNIMPCVLPVLALKLKSLTQKGAGTLKIVCALTTGGILAGFWILALLTIVLKTFFQEQVSWGIHLQNPYFVAVMVVLMMFGGCGLMGIFHINTPKWAGSLVAPGQGRSFRLQAFLSGLVAVLLATPCSAPFLGTALGFALTGQGMEIMVFYTAIALGFALPYILGMIFPMDKILPRPGAWMVTFEKILGFFFMLSAGWFVRTSLGGLLGMPWDRCALILWGVWMLVPLLGQRKGWKNWPRLHQIVVYVIPAVFSVVFVILPALPGPVEHPISMQDGSISWQVFSSSALESALENGKLVVVDLTGMACPLCIVNKSVFKNSIIQDRLTQKDVVCLRGDFTRANPELMIFLRKYGRSAIPFNLVISSKHPSGVVLSESLSVSELLQAIDFVDHTALKTNFK